MIKINKDQLSAIHTLLHKNNLKDQKADIVSAFTAGRSTSSKDLTKSEAAALIGHLKSLDKVDNSATKMRNKILSMAWEMHWVRSLTPSPSPEERGGQTFIKTVIDMQHVNNWCLKSSYLKKKLDDYKYEELPKLVSQFEEVYKSYLKGV